MARAALRQTAQTKDQDGKERTIHAMAVKIFNRCKTRQGVGIGGQVKFSLPKKMVVFARPDEAVEKIESSLRLMYDTEPTVA